MRSSFEDMNPAQAATLLDKTEDREALAAVLSMHRNGRIRELAVTSLDGSADPLVVPFLLLRCGEWVLPVRDEALRIIGPWLANEHAAVLLRSYPLLAGARFDPDRPAAKLRDLIADLLTAPSAAAMLSACIDERDLITTRNAVQVLVHRGGDSDLLERVLRTGDVVSVSMVSRAIPTTGADNRKTGELLVTHPTPRLRQEGVYRLLKEGGNGARGVAQQAMRDRSPSVRSTGQRWFREAGGDDAKFYRSLVAEDPLVALLGLGDDADIVDAEVARSHLGHAPAIRRAALRLLALLGEGEDREVFTDALLHGTGRERRSAIEWFRRTGTANECIDDAFRRAGTKEATEALVLVVNRLAPLTHVWKQVEIGIRALAADELTAQQAGIALLRRAVFQPSPSGLQRRPSGEHLDTMRSQLATHRARLWSAPVLRQELEHRLR